MSAADLHICKDSTKSVSDDTACECPPEYYCANICGEGYSLSTVISWQNFPRSTSSPSHCDDTSEEAGISLSGTEIPPSQKEDEKSSTQDSSYGYPITKSISELKALHYLEIRHVFELLNLLMGHLVCNEPEDPVQFLVDLLGKCLKYRDSFGEPPLLFTHSHIRSLYKAFDPFDRGYISLEQYNEAMKTLGLTNGIVPYNKEPQLNDDGDVEESYFVFEAERCLTENLKKMLRIPKLWEEDRLKWMKKMERKKAKLTKKKSGSETSTKKEEDTIDKFCKCLGSNEIKNDVTCRCITPTKVKNEPEQLFLDYCKPH